MNRERMIDFLRFSPDIFDVIIIGGGATGLGTAVDSAHRGFKTLLLEQSDFAKGTSSRSTKLIHGGLRYLKQGNVQLVFQALQERAFLSKNAPHLIKSLPFLIPTYKWWESSFYRIGLKIYDLLSSETGFEASKKISKEKILDLFPTLASKDLKGGIIYHDAQFDDARLALTLAKTCVDLNSVVVNYCKVTGLIKKNQKVCGAVVRDMLSNQEFRLHSKVVINATGVFSDSIRKMDDNTVAPMVQPSQGTHIVLDKRFLPSDTAVIIPHTEDNRVLFMIPWHSRVLIGTTDQSVKQASLEPKASREEVLFLLKHASKYLMHPPKPEDILSIFVGLRPLIKKKNKSTSSISRNHFISVSDTNLISIIGGKWTTYRKMGEDVIDQAIEIGNLKSIPSGTKNLSLYGYLQENDSVDSWDVYGSEREKITKMIREDPDLGLPLHPSLPYLAAEVVWAVKEEMAQTLEDVLARRTRAVFLDAKISLAIAPKVAHLMASTLGKEKEWEEKQLTEFQSIVKNYLYE